MKQIVRSYDFQQLLHSQDYEEDFLPPLPWEIIPLELEFDEVLKLHH